MLSRRDHVLCRLDELLDGDSRGFDLEGQGQASVFAVRWKGLVHVYADRCPHHGTPMAWRRDAYLNAARDRIVCAAHGAQFDIATGLCVLGPCLGDQLRSVPWRVDDGDLVALAAERSANPPP